MQFLGRLLRRAALVVVVVLICVVLFEVLLRTGIVSNDMHRKESRRQAWERAESRVAVVGDSFLDSRLGRMLDEEFEEANVGMLNLAIKGIGPYGYRDFVRDMRVEVPPDLLLLGYYVGNDLTDTRFRPDYRGTAEPPALVGRDWRDLYIDDYVRYKTESALFVHWEPDWDALEAHGVDADYIALAKEGEMSPYLVFLGMDKPTHLLDNILILGEENEAAWQTNAELIREIHAICKSRGTELACVVFPRSIQIDRSRFEMFERLKYELDDRTLESTRPQDLLAELCAAEGIPLLDLLPDLAAAAERDHFLENDDHMNELGNRLSADRIVPFVLEQLAKQ
ncbi:MAG: hypothetical protein AAGA20_08605 [Planctomycetota bacterium]